MDGSAGRGRRRRMRPRPLQAIAAPDALADEGRTREDGTRVIGELNPDDGAWWTRQYRLPSSDTLGAHPAGHTLPHSNEKIPTPRTRMQRELGTNMSQVLASSAGVGAASSGSNSSSALAFATTSRGLGILSSPGLRVLSPRLLSGYTARSSSSTPKQEANSKATDDQSINVPWLGTTEPVAPLGPQKRPRSRSVSTSRPEWLRASRTRSNPFASVDPPLYRYACVSRAGSGKLAASLEDRYAVTSSVASDIPSTLYCVCDGHGGKVAAEFVSQTLWRELSRILPSSAVLEALSLPESPPAPAPAPAPALALAAVEPKSVPAAVSSSIAAVSQPSRPNLYRQSPGRRPNPYATAVSSSLSTQNVLTESQAIIATSNVPSAPFGSVSADALLSMQPPSAAKQGLADVHAAIGAEASASLNTTRSIFADPFTAVPSHRSSFSNTCSTGNHSHGEAPCLGFAPVAAKDAIMAVTSLVKAPPPIALPATDAALEEQRAELRASAVRVVVVEDAKTLDTDMDGITAAAVVEESLPSEAVATAQQAVAAALVAAVEAVDTRFRATRLSPGSAGKTPTVTPRPAVPQRDETSLNESISKRQRNHDDDDPQQVLAAGVTAGAVGVSSPSGGGPVLDECPSGACGTTVTAVLALFDWLFVAWVGDSEAGVVRDGGSFVRLTPRTHVGSDIEEAERVRRVGGVVTGDRVGGVLELTRTVGDQQLHAMGAAAVPEVTWTRLTGKDDTLILASDGLWDVVSRKQVVDILRLSGRINTLADMAVAAPIKPIAPATSTRSDMAASGSPAMNAFGVGSIQPGTASHSSSVQSSVPSPVVVASSAAARASRRSLRAEVRVPAERLLAEAIRSGSADDITVMIVDLRIPSMPRSAAEAAMSGDEPGSVPSVAAHGGFVSPSDTSN